MLLLLWAGPAHAAGRPGILMGTLALAGMIGGIGSGLSAGLSKHPPRLLVSFAVYLGLLCATASTWVGTLDVVPLTLALGAAAGIVPFAAAHHAVRWLVRRLRKPGAPDTR